MNHALIYKAGRNTIVIAGLLLLVQTSLVWAAEDIVGEWEMKMDFGGRDSFATLSVTKNDDGTLLGKWGSRDLSDIKFDGEKLTFVRTIRFGDQEFSMDYSGVLKDGKLTGTMSSDRGEFAANGTRKKPKLPAVGQWDIKFNVMDRDINAKLIVSQAQDGKLEGKWTEEMGEHTISNIKFEGDKLTFVRKSKIEDFEFENTYEGTVKGDELTGKLKGEMGEWQANGKRFGTPLIGKWELTVTSDWGTHPGMMIIEPDLSGRYELFGEIPMKDLKLEGDQVTFYVEFGPPDQTFKMEFKGKLEGKALKGQMESDRGTSEITGKKVEKPVLSGAEGKVEQKAKPAM
jgi:hypothetical protein